MKILVLFGGFALACAATAATVKSATLTVELDESGGLGVCRVLWRAKHRCQQRCKSVGTHCARKSYYAHIVNLGRAAYGKHVRDMLSYSYQRKRDNRLNCHQGKIHVKPLKHSECHIIAIKWL